MLIWNGIVCHCGTSSSEKKRVVLRIFLQEGLLGLKDLEDQSVAFALSLAVEVGSAQFLDFANLKMLRRKTISLWICVASKSGLFGTQLSILVSGVERTRIWTPEIRM